MLDKFVKIETYNDGIVYILVSNICSIEEHERIKLNDQFLHEKYTSIAMNSGDRYTVKCPISDIWAILEE
jgi:hypothetical protein